MNWKHVGTIIILSLLLIGAMAGCSAKAGEPGRIQLSANEFDFGIIPNTSPVSHVFEVHNTGEGQLEITGLSTSCGCTTAEVGSRKLAPGESTDLAVTYDPLAHDGATGEFMRIVYVRSDDPDIPEARITIQVAVVEP